MKVLFVTSSFARSADDPIAAAGKGVFELVSELGTKLEGTVITPEVAGAPANEQIGGITVQRIPPSRPTDSLANAITGRRALRVGRVARAMKRSAAQLAPSHDIAHAFWFFPGGWSIAGVDRPKIVTVPGGIETYPSYPVVGGFVRRIIRSMDLCVGFDTSGERRLAELGAPRTVQIPNVFRSEGFPVVAPVSQPRLIFVGRLAPEKGVDVLLEALATARNSRADIELEIVGDGPSREGLVSQASRLGISHAVTFRGSLAPAQIGPALARAQVLVLPSRREGLPAAALEALSTGRPVVASAVGGLADLLGEDCGLTVPPGDPQALARSLLAAVDRDWDPALLHQRVEGFDVAHAAQSYLTLYRSLVDDQESSR